MVSGGQIVKAIVFGMSWTVFALGLYVTVIDLLSGRTDPRMVFVPLFGILSILLTYAVVDDFRMRRKRLAETHEKGP